MQLDKIVRTPAGLALAGFIANVILGNLFVPLSQEASWQRFRAFAQGPGFNAQSALWKSVSTAVALWIGLILVAFALQLVLAPAVAAKLTSMAPVLEALRGLNDWWFPLFIFPIMTVAALSAMYSTADTCVSALLYLIDYSRVARNAPSVPPKEIKSLGMSYYLAMVVLFSLALGIYGFVRYWFHPTILQLVFSVFSNLVVVAPTLIATTVLRPAEGDSACRLRTRYVVISLFFGFACYWGAALPAIVLGGGYLWMSQLAIAAGLVGAALPVGAMIWHESRLKRAAERSHA